MTLRSRLELASAAFNATKPPRRGKRIRELEAQNKQLLEVLKYVRAVLPSDRWADDTKKMIDASTAGVAPVQQDAVKQIAEALRQIGLTLAKTATGYAVMKLGEVTAQAAPVQQDTDKLLADKERLERLLTTSSNSERMLRIRIAELEAQNKALLGTLKWLDRWMGDKSLLECANRVRAAIAAVKVK